jgi:hypothetical protein
VSGRSHAVGEIDIVVSVDTGPCDAATVRGSVESRYGRRPFAGWLDLLGQLEQLVERARHDETRIEHDDPSAGANR